METLKEIQEEFLKCPICLQTYTNPKLLPCLHTFCKDCLSECLVKASETKTETGSAPENRADEIVSNPTENTSKHFNCPVCRAEISLNVPNGNKNVQQWSDLLPDNHFVSSLMEKIDIQSTEKICESCSEIGDRSGAAAENWCQTCKIAFCDSCIKAHNVIKACREHIVISLKDMRTNPLQSIRENKKEIPCYYHKDKVIEYYCVDCHVAICSSCVAVQHRRCEMVETTIDAVQKLKPETEYVSKNLEKQNEILRDWEQEHKKELKELSVNKESVVKEMLSFRGRVNEVLMNLENKMINTIDEKHKQTAKDVNTRLKEIEEMKKNINNTYTFFKNLTQYGSDSELLAVFDAIKLQTDDMRANIQKSRMSKLSTRLKFAPDPCIQRLMELQTMGKILDLIDLNKEHYLNGFGDREPPQRQSSVKRTGTFRVDRPDSAPVATPTSSVSSNSSASNESLGSQELTPPSRTRRGVPPRPTPRDSVKQPLAPRNTAARAALHSRSSTLPRTPRSAKVKKDISNSSQNVSPQKKSSDPELSTQKKRSSEEIENVNPQSPKNGNVPLLFGFNGKTNGDSKKCWPLDVAVLEDGTPVITDFHNKKIKAFDATGSVMGEVSVPSWPHGIVDISSQEVAVTLPELATLLFVNVQEKGMRIRKRIRTTKQYRGISCDANTSPSNPTLVVSCCASGIQCVDVLSLDGTVIQTYRNDTRHPGKLLFTWPYYVTTNTQGEILVSDCQAKNGILCIYRNGEVKYEQVLPDNIVNDPRGICTDRQGNLFLADKTGNGVHCLGPDGKYKAKVLSASDGLNHPIALCFSPFGQLIVTQENGEVKVYKYS